MIIFQYKIFKTTSLSVILNTLFASMLLLLMSLAINYLAAFTLKGLEVIVTFSLALIIRILYFTDSYDFNFNFFTDKSQLILPLLYLLVILLVYGSYKFSLYIFKKRFSINNI